MLPASVDPLVSGGTASSRRRRASGAAAGAATLVGVVVLVSSALATGVDLVPAAASGSADPNAWTVYHGDAAGHGVSPAAVSVDTSRPAWTSPALGGPLYGEPLVAGGRVYVATEDDRVDALSAATGTVLWSTKVGTAVPASSLACGNIQPTVGITGTPVIDQDGGEIFVVAEAMVNGSPTHQLVGLNTASGRIELAQRVDPPGALASALLQRTGLTLDGGRVVFGFGGNYGDCSTYRGWLVSVGEAGGTPRDFAVDAGPGQSRGAIWMGGGAPAVDAQGNIWVSAGNGSVVSSRQAYDNSDSVLELSPALQLLQFFAPSGWAADNAADRDLSMEPALLADGQVVVAGKSRIAYALDGARLGGIGGQQAALASVCPDDVDGGGAVLGNVVYLPCTAGVVALRVSKSPPTIGKAWSSTAGGGPPIVAGGLVWTLGTDGALSGLDPATGAVRQQAMVGPSDNHFPTPALGDGLLLVPSGNKVVAFGTHPNQAAAPTTAAPTTRPPPRPAGLAADRSTGLSPGAVVGLVLGGGLALAILIWLWRRRRGRVPRPGG